MTELLLMSLDFFRFSQILNPYAIVGSKNDTTRTLGHSDPVKTDKGTLVACSKDRHRLPAKETRLERQICTRRSYWPCLPPYTLDFLLRQ